MWPAGTVYVPRQPHAPSTGERMVNHPFEWMGAIRDALKDAGVKMVPPDYRGVVRPATVKRNPGPELRTLRRAAAANLGGFGETGLAAAKCLVVFQRNLRDPRAPVGRLQAPFPWGTRGLQLSRRRIIEMPSS